MWVEEVRVIGLESCRGKFIGHGYTTGGLSIYKNASEK